MNEHSTSGQRRTFLKRSAGAAGILALASLPALSGCEEETIKAPTAPVVPSDDTNKLTLDLADEKYAALAATGGILDIDTKKGETTLKLLVFRESATTAATIARLCTHQGCDLAPRFSGTLLDQDTIQCGCHGSRFNVLTGAVEKGPAVTNLKAYPTVVSGNSIIITIE